LPTSNTSAILMKMKGSHGSVQHDGTVKKVDSNSVLVSISSESACSGCHAEKLCTISGEKEKIVEIKGNYDVAPGDAVTILMEQSMGYKALFIGYLIPLLIVMASLIIMSSFSVSELLTGLISISVLVPYFLILFFFRNRIDRGFTFKLKV